MFVECETGCDMLYLCRSLCFCKLAFELICLPSVEDNLFLTAGSNLMDKHKYQRRTTGRTILTQTVPTIKYGTRQDFMFSPFDM